MLLLLLLATLACARGGVTPTPPLPPPQPGVPATATPLPLSGIPVALPTPAEQNRFAPYLLAETEPVSTTAGYQLDPGAIRDGDLPPGLTGAQGEQLRARAFLALPTRYPSFTALYRQVAAENYPLFITVDSATHALDLVADVAWERAEHTLAADLEALSAGLVTATLAQWEAAPDEATAEAARLNLAFFTVGHRLQNPEAEIPAAVAGVVREELTLIAEGGTFVSPLFGSSRNYGRFRESGTAPAGFHQARTWYAYPISLAAEPPVVRRQARQLLLMASALHASENYSRWQRIYSPLAYFLGNHGGWTMETVTLAAEALYGTVPPAAEVADPDALEDFIATMRLYQPPPSLSPATEPRFRLLPAPERPDRAWLDRFVFNQVGSYTGEAEALPLTLVETAVGPVRGLPRLLDLAAAQDSTAASRILERDGDRDFVGYSAQLAAARAHFGALAPSTWAQSWTGGWHYGLQPLLVEPARVPVAADEAWEVRTLNSWYGAWVRLQSPTLLAARPVAPEVPLLEEAGYVEPAPAVYARLAALARQLYGGLARYGLLEAEVDKKLLQLERLLLAFQEIATQEVAGAPLTEDQVLLLRQAGIRLENLLTFAPPAGGNVPLTENSIARILDVYTGPGGEQTLQAGVGGVWPLYVLVPGADGETAVAMGGIFAPYELTIRRDEKWEPETWLEGSGEAAPATWSEEFLAP